MLNNDFGHDAQIKAKENYQKELMSRYGALYNDLAKALSDADKQTIRKRIADLDQEVTELGDEIKKLRAANAKGNESYRSYTLEWEEKLPEIDLVKSKKIIRSVFDRFAEQQDEQAIFLLQSSRSMGGDLCVRHIKALLQNLGTWCSPFEFGFQAHQQTNPIDFLKALAERFEAVPAQSSSRSDVEAIARKLCASLRSGNVLLIHVDIYSIGAQDGFLEWFVNDFWDVLTQQLSGHRQAHPFIKLVSVIAVRSVVPKSQMGATLCCTKQRFDSRKIMELPLQKQWTEIEIRNWLLRFAGLDAPQIGLTRSEIEAMAKNIHIASGGTPSQVYHELMETLKAMTGPAS